MGVDNDSFGGNGFTEQNNLMCYNEHNDAVNGMVNGGQGSGSGSSGENGPGSNDTCVNVNSGPSGVNVGSSLQIAQQPVGGGGIRWERFLPVRSLKVLLVENDDSTRHVVSALLRNCCYEVMAAANGLEAWSVLQDQNSRIDLVLTEVVMPLLSGIGLLCKITSHKKNIPVIMMSSHDSMGIVFNCLSKGAADFLVKPIRKNELKNLWQHVWRRCHSSSVSGSESGTQTKRSAKLRSSDVSETNTCSSENGNDEHDNGSDDGSGTQSSWTKRAVNVDSPRSMSPHKLAAPDSTCAQVIQLMPEADNKSWVCDTETKDYYDQYECDNAALGKDLKMENSGNPDSQCEYQSKKVPAYSVCKRQIKLPELESKLLNIGDNLKNIAPNSSPIASSSSRKIESRDISTPSGSVSISHIKDKACCDTEEAPYLELTLNRISGVGGGTARPYDRNVLRHSDLSAFSKYNTASSATKIPTGNADGSSPLDNNSVRMKMETMQNYLSHSSGTQDQQSNGSSNNNVASLNIVAPKAEGFIETPESISAFRSSHSSVFQPLNSSVSSLQPGTTWGTEDVTGNTPKSQLRSPHQQIQIQRHHHHYHHHVQRVKQHQPQCDEQSLQKMAAAAPQCGSSNAVAEPNERNSGNCSVNGSVSGSNLGSNGLNGSTTILNARVESTESEHGATGSKGAGSTSGRISGNGADEDRVALREAALTKFRQKRKERCFGKKVRYQSRKRLAEQRPRVRGQFVRQIVSGSSTGKECNQSNDLLSEGNSCNSLQ